MVNSFADNIVDQCFYIVVFRFQYLALGLSKIGHQGTNVFSRILLQCTAESLFMFNERDEIK